MESQDWFKNRNIEKMFKNPFLKSNTASFCDIDMQVSKIVYILSCSNRDPITWA